MLSDSPHASFHLDLGTGQREQVERVSHTSLLDGSSSDACRLMPIWIMCQNRVRLPAGIIVASLTPRHSEWYRLFVGDVSNDVNERTLNEAFNQYPSYCKCKVVKDRLS